MRGLLLPLLAAAAAAQGWHRLSLPAPPLTVLPGPRPHLVLPTALRELRWRGGGPELGPAVPLPRETLFVEPRQGSLYLLTRGGALLRFRAGDAFTTLARGPAPLTFPSPPLAVSFLAGRAAWVPVAGGYCRLAFDGRRTPFSFPPEGELALRPAQGTEALVAVRRYPAVDTADLDGDGRKEILLFFERRILVYRGGRCVGTLRLSPRTHGTRFLKVTLPPIVRDLDGDGTADLLEPDPHGGTLTWRRGPLLGRPARPPERRWRTGGTLLALRVRDLDGDGHPEVLMVTARDLNLLRAVRVFLSRELPVRLLLLRGGPEGPSPRAAGVLDATVPLGVRRDWDRPRPVPRVCLALGRTAAGVPLLYRVGGGRLHLHPWAEGAFVPRPRHSRRLPGSVRRLWLLPLGGASRPVLLAEGEACLYLPGDGE